MSEKEQKKDKNLELYRRNMEELERDIDENERAYKKLEKREEGLNDIQVHIGYIFEGIDFGKEKVEDQRKLHYFQEQLHNAFTSESDKCEKEKELLKRKQKEYFDREDEYIRNKKLADLEEV